MARKNKRFERPFGERRYRKIFIVATEGKITERQYFNAIKPLAQAAAIHVECLTKTKNSSPTQVLKQMKQHLKENALKDSDEAWLVVDKDQWPEEHLHLLHAWSKERGNRGFALSNPKFEYWLLLHFEDGNDVANSNECSVRLSKHLPGYDKSIDSRKFPRANIENAVRLAKERHKLDQNDWPRKTGSTVYRLVEKILQS